ncbi:gliding motility-associated C-terminal domain-containing protein [Foetidibacter luteolus]|uniref:T9SS type B sorting domain-containing protein n=1 Tax=Foetidibacter luteolus TaxID=2608880 RepID=UPI00129B75B6|nr:gliding motility-associated C-terminal domain-containing protein [Foetidibacter luteolus]
MCGWPKHFVLLIIYVLLQCQGIAQVCGTPGIDGPTNAAPPINTYYPTGANTVLLSGSSSVLLEAVPPTDAFGNSYGITPVSPGDLLLLIQVQDATIYRSNDNLYGSNDATAGPDGLGGTGYTSLGNAGIYEYVVALNSVPLTGGLLNFRGGGPGGTLVNAYTSHPGDGDQGKKTFQVVRVPQFSSLTLSQDITCPPFNGYAGGIIAFDVAADFDFNGHTINASARGFRGGFQGPDVASGCNTPATYGSHLASKASVKGEGIAGTPRHTWNGFDSADYGAAWLGFPGNYYGRGAPANAGGGGADHNSGGGGGGNGGAGGGGGDGVLRVTVCSDEGTDRVSGGRPGINLPATSPHLLFMGGGGGAGDADNVSDGNGGGVGGGIILINAFRIIGTGTILANGGNGTTGTPKIFGDGAGGGGAGGTILINAIASSGAVLNLSANGGNGGHTINFAADIHGPGGGGGGGIIWHNVPSAVINTQVTAGVSGLTASGAGIPYNAQDGAAGIATSFLQDDLPDYLKGKGATCLPTLVIEKSEMRPGVPGARTAGNNAVYTLTITNVEPQSGAGGVTVNDVLPAGFSFVSASVAYSNWASGPTSPVNSGTAANPVLGTFNIPGGGVVTITMTAYIDPSVIPGMYHNGAQVLYFDPTRTFLNPLRQITPQALALAGQNTVYEAGQLAGTAAGGSNYDSASAGPNSEDVYVIENGILTSNSPICQDEDIVLTVTPPALKLPLTYSWSGPNSFTSTAQNPTITSAQPVNSGIYTVLITDANGYTSALSTTVNVGAKYSITVETEICEGGSVNGHTVTGSYRDVFKSVYGCDSIVVLDLLVKPTSSSSLSPVICEGESYEGYTTSGTYVDVLVAANGCDSTRTINLTVLPKAYETINPIICEGESYEGYTTAGTYTDILVAANGCDSVRTINLTVLPKAYETINPIICEGESYEGYTTSGTYVDVLVAANGCDSVRTINLTVKPKSHTTLNPIICEGDSYEGYTTSGTYTDILLAANGCDSVRTINLTVNKKSYETLNPIICEGDSYEGYTTSGTYTDILVAANGCDSVRTINLTVNKKSYETLNPIICEGDSYEGYTTSGTYTDILVAANGCDSIRTINLTVKARSYTSFSPTICQGESYEGYKVSGTYTDIFPAANGCDSIRTINLTVKPRAYSLFTPIICDGESYQGYTVRGTYVDTLVAANGCDSIRTIRLTVNPKASSILNVSICEGQSYLGYTISGTYVDVLVAANGCDSIRTLNLTVKSKPRISITQSICEGEDYAGYTTSGTYIDTFPTANGCDSIRTLYLQVKPKAYSSIDAVICEGESFLGYNSSGTYTDRLVAANGCDSIRTIHLTVNRKSYATLEQSICEGENYLGYTRNGIYIDTLVAANGCDSIRTIRLTVLSRPAPSLGPDKEICSGDSILLSPGIFKNYTWQDGSSQPAFVVVAPGVYYVQVTDICGTARDEISIVPGNCNVYFPSGFTPNGDGRNDVFRVLNGLNLQDYRLTIFNRWGQKIFETTNPSTGWNGMHNGRPLPMGSYVWFSSFNKQGEVFKMKGTITLIR